VREEGTLVEPREAFDDFYLRQYRGVVGLAYALSGNRWISEELAQEAFLAAHVNWSRVGTYARPELWVRRVVANLSVSSFRRRLAEAKALGRVALRREPAVAHLSAENTEFWEAVRSLPHRQAQVVALFYLEDRPVAEIAEILGVAVGTVKKHLYDGRRTLARVLELDVEEDAS
jgi:RNA polymerase sigma-70 factor (ECF subfamily)